MEIDEALERIFRRHWWLIVICLVVPMVIVFGITGGSSAKYVSQPRVLVSATTPTSAQQADALTSHARAIATSPTIVAAALKQAGSTEDATHFAQHNVSVSELGTSPIVALKVTASSPAQAQQIAAALAGELVGFINDVGQGGIPAALTQMQARITTTTNQLNALDNQLAANPASVSLISQATSLRGLLDSMVGDYDRLLTQQATQSPARVVSAALVPTGAQPAGRAQEVILAGLLGLVVGLLLAALLESVRPTVNGTGRLARLLDAPQIGTLNAAPDDAADAAVARQVRFAATRVGADTIVFVSVAGEVGRLARRIERHLLTSEPAVFADGNAGVTDGTAGSDGHLGQPDGSTSDSGRVSVRTATMTTNGLLAGTQSGLRVRTLAQLDPPAAGELDTPRMGVLVLAPRSVRRRAVTKVSDLVATTGWPVLGVIEVPRARRG